jgi:hypothetical protein
MHKVIEEFKGKVVIDLDVKVGSVFVENRYTDWGFDWLHKTRCHF